MKKLLFTLLIAVTMLCGTGDLSAASAQSGDMYIPPCISTPSGLKTLEDIAGKCEETSDSDELNFTQKEYAFMIQFCNEILEGAGEADANGTSESFLENNKPYVDMVEGFATLLSAAYQEGSLSAANKQAFEKLIMEVSNL